MLAASFMSTWCLCGDSVPVSSQMSSAPLRWKPSPFFARRCVAKKRTTGRRSGHQWDVRNGGLGLEVEPFQLRPVPLIAATVALPAAEGVPPKEGR